ncbi:MAG: WD40 repeat domain-containing protein, partial [Candidatus Omnitrophota bacterium]
AEHAAIEAYGKLDKTCRQGLRKAIGDRKEFTKVFDVYEELMGKKEAEAYERLYSFIKEYPGYEGLDIRLEELTTGRSIKDIVLSKTLHGHTDWVNTAQFSPDGKKIVTASDDGTAKVWDALSGKELLTLRGHAGWVLSAEFSPDSKKIVTASSDVTAKVWDALSGKELLTLQGHAGWVLSAEFSPDSRKIVTASFDKTAKVWDALSGEELQTLQGHTDRVNTAQFSPDSRKIVTASNDKTVRIWYASNGEEFQTLQSHTDRVNTAQFSSDSKKIVTASDDKTAKVWDALSGKELQTLQGHTNAVYTARFSPDSNKIVTASTDDTAKVWDALSGKELLTLQGHTNAVYTARFSPDGNKIVTAGADGTAKIWDIIYADGGISYSRLGASVDMKDYEDHPQASAIVDGNLIAGARDRSKREYPGLDNLYEDPAFQGFAWASSMASASAIIKVEDQYLFLLNEELKARLTALSSEEVTAFLYLLIIHEAQELSVRLNNVIPDINTEIASELRTIEAYNGLLPSEKETIKSVCLHLSNADRYMQVIAKYEELLQVKADQDRKIEELLVFIINRYPVSLDPGLAAIRFSADKIRGYMIDRKAADNQTDNEDQSQETASRVVTREQALKHFARQEVNFKALLAASIILIVAAVVTIILSIAEADLSLKLFTSGLLAGFFMLIWAWGNILTCNSMINLYGRDNRLPYWKMLKLRLSLQPDEKSQFLKKSLDVGLSSLIMVGLPLGGSVIIFGSKLYGWGMLTAAAGAFTVIAFPFFIYAIRFIRNTGLRYYRFIDFSRWYRDAHGFARYPKPSRLGASMDPQDYEFMPQPSEPVDDMVMEAALTKLRDEYPVLAAESFDKPEFQGFAWASSMASAACINNDNLFLMDARLKDSLAGAASEAITHLLYLLVVHEAVELALKLQGIEPVMQTEIAAERFTLFVYSKLSFEQRSALRDLCATFSETGYTEVLAFYDQMAGNPLSDDDRIIRLAAFIRKYPDYGGAADNYSKRDLESIQAKYCSELQKVVSVRQGPVSLPQEYQYAFTVRMINIDQPIKNPIDVRAGRGKKMEIMDLRIGKGGEVKDDEKLVFITDGRGSFTMKNIYLWGGAGCLVKKVSDALGNTWDSGGREIWIKRRGVKETAIIECVGGDTLEVR